MMRRIKKHVLSLVIMLWGIVAMAGVSSAKTQNLKLLLFVMRRIKSGINGILFSSNLELRLCS